MKIKNKGKRSISILTVFLWLALIAVMTVITISGIIKSNAFEAVRPRFIFKVKVEGISEEELEGRYENASFAIQSNGNSNEYLYRDKENEYYVYTLEGEDKVFKNDYSNISIYEEPPSLKDVYGYMPYTEYEINGEKYTTNWSYLDIDIDNVELSYEDENIIYVTHKYVKTTEQGITKSASWVNKDEGMAKIRLQYLPVISNTIYKKSVVVAASFRKELIYIDKLSNDFKLSDEYVTDNKWSILETTSGDEYLDVWNEFFDEDGILTGKKYVYVKSTNTVYWYIDKNNFSTAEEVDTFEFNIVYKNLNDEILKDEILDTNIKAECYNIFQEEFKINIDSPKLEYVKEREAIIKINKEIKGEEGENIYYIGLFTDEVGKKADKVYEMKTVEGKGDLTIEIEKYNLEDNYYIYEVDKEGNKIADKKINYSRNNVVLKKENSLSIRNIIGNDKVVSSLISTDMTGVDKGRGTGKQDYIDNVLSIRDVYVDNVTISSEEIKYKVTYIPEEGGTLEGEKEEMIKEGEYPQNVPTPKSDETYEFVKWEVEKDGKRIEVEPGEYKITEDTVFYAIFNKIPVEVDTSDMNVERYVVVSLIAIVGIVVGIFIIKRSKKSTK